MSIGTLLQILILRFLESVLPHWSKKTDQSRVSAIVERLFNLLGKVIMGCSADPTLFSPSKAVSKYVKLYRHYLRGCLKV